METGTEHEWDAGGSTSADGAGQPVVRLLGPLAVGTLEHTQIAPLLGQIVALLALHRGVTVALDTIKEELWGPAPPKTASTTIQTYIGRLRRLLAEQLGTSLAHVTDRVLVTHGRGYCLDVPTDTVRFMAAFRESSAALRREDHPATLAVSQQALALWRGTPLSNLTPGHHIDVSLVQYHEAHLLLHIHWLTAMLRLEREHEALPLVSSLAAAHPYHEEINALHVEALYLCGRRKDALMSISSFRSRFRESMGLDIPRRFRELHAEIIA